ncbi:MAG: hypothetical protein CM1200mP27_03400 [Chloroflexota bacterium]|nr:MAG: hypothetical protein CM1200mP27_03400 [Chloroflexota bacterium]
MTSEPSNFLPSGPLRAFSIIAAALFLNNTVALMLGPLLVDIAKEFDISVAVAGQLIAAMSFTWAIFAPLAGPFSDSFGRRLIALIGLGLMGACTLSGGICTKLLCLDDTSTWHRDERCNDSAK